MGIIYCARNKVNGKRYIGQSKVELKIRVALHKSNAKSNRSGLFWDAIREFGFDAFDWTVLFDCVPEYELDELERDSISVYGTQHPNGYNIESGGKFGYSATPETRRKMSTAKRNPSDETRRKLSASSKGRVLSDEHKRKLSEAHKNPSAETRNKMSQAAKNISDATRKKKSEAAKNISPETRQKMKDGAKRRPPISEETRFKMSESQKRRKYKDDK